LIGDDASKLKTASLVCRELVDRYCVYGMLAQARNKPGEVTLRITGILYASRSQQEFKSCWITTPISATAYRFQITTLDWNLLPRQFSI